jgi:hypothetical protein
MENKIYRHDNSVSNGKRALYINFLSSFTLASTKLLSLKLRNLQVGNFILPLMRNLRLPLTQLVSSQVLETIKGELIGVTKHSDALNILETYGIKAYSQALSMLGYKVKWSGLDPEKAEIVKI